MSRHRQLAIADERHPSLDTKSRMLGADRSAQNPGAGPASAVTRQSRSTTRQRHALALERLRAEMLIGSPPADRRERPFISDLRNNVSLYAGYRFGGARNSRHLLLHRARPGDARSCLSTVQYFTRPIARHGPVPKLRGVTRHLECTHVTHDLPKRRRICIPTETGPTTRNRPDLARVWTLAQNDVIEITKRSVRVLTTFYDAGAD